QAPEDVALLSTLPGWTIDVPGHPDEAERALLDAFAGENRIYVRLSEESNTEAVAGEKLTVLRRGSDRGALVVAVGPTLDPVLAATEDLDVTVAYVSRVRPFDREGLRSALPGSDV